MSTAVRGSAGGYGRCRGTDHAEKQRTQSTQRASIVIGSACSASLRNPVPAPCVDAGEGTRRAASCGMSISRLVVVLLAVSWPLADSHAQAPLPQFDRVLLLETTSETSANERTREHKLLFVKSSICVFSSSLYRRFTLSCQRYLAEMIDLGTGNY